METAPEEPPSSNNGHQQPNKNDPSPTDSGIDETPSDCRKESSNMQPLFSLIDSDEDDEDKNEEEEEDTFGELQSTQPIRRKTHSLQGPMAPPSELAMLRQISADSGHPGDADAVDPDDLLKKCASAPLSRKITMVNTPFANGAMRQCFRMKKLSSKKSKKANPSERDWKRAHNYVAKNYMSGDVPRETLFEDVKLQMDAKLWAEEYNRHKPPKKVDIFQIMILEFTDREGSPLYHLEHFIEGDYIKYNSNSGFVDETDRQTPQAFSHFTFERSGHQQIVVDIQGVGDLYTDPQIHTVDGQNYGDGNLGTKGMALFFYSHACNLICNSMELTAFDLAPTENAARRQRLSSVLSLKNSQSDGQGIDMENLEKGIDMENRSRDALELLRQRVISERESHDDDGTGDAYFLGPIDVDVKGSPSSAVAAAVSSPQRTDKPSMDSGYPASPRSASMADDDGQEEEFHENTIDSSTLTKGEIEEEASASSSKESSSASIQDEFERYLAAQQEKRRLSAASKEQQEKNEQEEASSKPKTKEEEKPEEEKSEKGEEKAQKGEEKAEKGEEKAEKQEISPPAAGCRTSRIRFASSMCDEEEDGDEDAQSERDKFWAQMRKMSRPAGIILSGGGKPIADGSEIPEKELAAFLERVRRESEESAKAERKQPPSVLGQVHLEMARYHELGRFLEVDEETGEAPPREKYDRAAAWYHLELAAKCNVLEALMTAAHTYLGMPHDLLEDFTVEADDDETREENQDQALEWMEKAAEYGNREAITYMATSYKSGLNLGSEREKSYAESLKWYERLLEAIGELEEAGEEVSMTETPKYQVQATMAELLREGGHGLIKDPERAAELYNEAAESAMEAGKGKMSTKYYMLSEECYGEVEEPEEE